MKKILLVTLILAGCFAYAPVQAQTGTTQAVPQAYIPLEPLTQSSANGYSSIGEYLRVVYLVAVSAGSLFAVVMLTISGARYMLSDALTSKEAARKRIQTSLYGLLLLVSSFLILYVINPNLLRFQIPELKFVPPAVTNSTWSGSSLTNIGSCLGVTCMPAEAQKKYENAQKVVEKGYVFATKEEVEQVKKDVEDIQNINTQQETNCRNSGGEVYRGSGLGLLLTEQGCIQQGFQECTRLPTTMGYAVCAVAAPAAIAEPSRDTSIDGASAAPYIAP